MRKLVYIFLALVLAGSSALAQNKILDSLWQAANDNYAMGHFSSAIDSYNAIYNSGYESAKLYYNLGNAYYRANNMGKAVLFYKKALKLEPSNVDAKANLAMAKARCVDKIEQVPEFMIVTWIRNVRDMLSSNAWCIIAVAAILMVAIISLLFRFFLGSRGRKIASVFWLIGILLFLISLCFSISLYNKAKGGGEAVVVSAVGSIKSSPSQDGNPVFILHEGTDVKMLEKIEDWCKIEIADGRQGWVKSSDLEVI